MRGPVGDLWKKALREDDDLKAEYSLVPRNFDAQRAYRRRWVEKQFAAVQERLRHLEVSSEFEHLRGKKMSMAQLVWELKSKRAAAYYAEEAWRRHRLGQKFRPNKPWVTWDSWTRTLKKRRRVYWVCNRYHSMWF